MKREGKFRGESLRGLKALVEDYPQARAYFVYGGGRVMRQGKIEILPLPYCFQKLPQILAGE